MTLQLQKVYFKNWKCYLEQTVNLYLDDNSNLDIRKNILVIAGQNGAGKTSFQTGVLWCLYGDDVISRQDLIKCFNRINVKKNPELDLLVRLTFIDEQHIYNIQRAATIIKRGSSYIPKTEEIKLYLDGKEKPDANERIEFLLPRSCREFFFFDGTKIDEYAKLTHNTETRQAIERTLGIPEIRNLRDDAQGVVKKFETKLREASKTRTQLQEIITKATAIKQEIAAKQGQLKKIKYDLAQYKKFLQDNELRISQIEELTKKQSELQAEIRKKEGWKQQVNNLDSKIGIALQNSPIIMLSNLIREASDDLESKTVAKTRFSVNVDLLKELVNEQICVCGRCLDNDSYLFLKQQIDSLEENVQNSQVIIELSNTLAQLRSLIRFQLPDINTLLQQRDILSEDIDELTQVIKRKQLETSDFDSEEAKLIWEKQGTIKGDIKNCQASQKRIEEEIITLKQQLNKFKSQQEQLASENRATSTLNHQIKLAEQLKQASEELINWYIDDSRNSLEEHTSEIHRKITNKPDEYTGIQVKPDYTLAINHVNEYSINPETLSSGEKEALAFAFIVGLNLISRPARLLMMDTPFGNLDQEHKKNIIQYLSNIRSQVILLATDSDISEDLLQELQPFISQVHRVSRLNGSEDASVIEVER
jgi:DNA sulfur modification protein DndD